MEGYATTNIHLNVNNWIRTFSKFRVANASKKVMGYFYEYANIAAIFATLRITLVVGCNKFFFSRNFL